MENVQMKTNIILQGDALSQLKTLPNESIDCCMTSPPYWALRDYGVEGQLGLEPTFEEYINKLCDIFDEVKRVLKKTGTCWVNLGDTYYTKSGTSFVDDNLTHNKHLDGNKGLFGDVKNTNVEQVTKGTGINKANELRGIKQYWDGKNFVQKIKLRKRFCCECGKEFDALPHQYFCGSACSGVDNTPRNLKGKFPDKTLCMIPFRFAIEMVNRGWILRNTIIWNKPNCMPSSVKDRFTVDFEYLFFFTKSKKYFFETQYEEQKTTNTKDRLSGHRAWNNDPTLQRGAREGSIMKYNPQGRNKRAVWKINPKPFKESHFAVYPEELCETPIKAGCPEFICNKCGKVREKIIELEKNETKRNLHLHTKYQTEEQEKSVRQGFHSGRDYIEPTKIHKGYTDCKCNAGFSGGVCLDPFFGSGTTGLVSLKQNKQFIGIELNPEYIEIAKRRLKPYLEQKKL